MLRYILFFSVILFCAACGNLSHQDSNHLDDMNNPINENFSPNPLSRFLVQYDTVDVYYAVCRLLNDDVKLDVFEYPISKNDKGYIDSLMNIDSVFNDINMQLKNYFVINTALDLPFMIDDDMVKEPTYFEEIVFHHDKLNFILIDILNSEERSWSSLSYSESIELKSNVIMYLMSMHPTEFMNTMKDFYGICEREYSGLSRRDLLQ